MKKLSKKQTEELKVLENQSEYEIDTSDIPEKQIGIKPRSGNSIGPLKSRSHYD